MNISAITSHLSHAQNIAHDKSEIMNPEPDSAANPSFSKMLERSITEVDQMLKTSDKKMTEVAVGKSENLHEAMIAFEKADVAFKLLVQVRSKAMEAYHEIMRMQV